MSNALAIAAVTATLRNLLQAGLATDPDLNDVTVTMQPLDRARVSGNTANQMNVFLYHVLPSGAWRNADLPGRTKQGESAGPTLGLNLYYLLTAFGKEDDSSRPFSHQILGRALSILNDHPLLGSREIQESLPNNDLWNQVERVRFTLQPFSVEEIAKLWTGFQTQYRLSMAYEAAVVLIESTRPALTPLPILTRGARDSGIVAQSNTLPPFPALAQLLLPNQQVTARLGDKLTLTGHNLSGSAVSVQFSPAGLPAPASVPIDKDGTDAQVTVTLPNDAANWPAGVYSLHAIVMQGIDTRTTNVLPMAIAPQITSKLPMTVKRPARIKLTCSPEVQPSQRVYLLLGMFEIGADAHPASTSQMSFSSEVATPGTYLVRLRVDGVDSQLIQHNVKPPTFDATQTVKIT